MQRYCEDNKSTNQPVNYDKLIDDFPNFGLTYNLSNPSNSKIDRAAGSEKDCKGDDIHRLLEPNLRCKDEFTLIQKNKTIYLARTYWSKVSMTHLESSQFCLLSYDETQKSAQFCGPKDKEPEPKYR